ncbi:hypothetical protein FVER53263_20920 [Fusarium verticillioides]|nr:hypothetical protein FVER53263_20920 [Fusarium verticillioides]
MAMQQHQDVGEEDVDTHFVIGSSAEDGFDDHRSSYADSPRFLALASQYSIGFSQFLRILEVAVREADQGEEEGLRDVEGSVVYKVWPRDRPRLHKNRPSDAVSPTYRHQVTRGQAQRSQDQPGS